MTTWKQFKDYIDAELKRLGIPEDVEVEYIDLMNDFVCTHEDLYIGGDRWEIGIYSTR